MKRISADASTRLESGGERTEIRPVCVALDVTAYLRGFEESVRCSSHADALLAEDFADFLAEGTWIDLGRPPLDPIFRERLRRRLWRMHAGTRLRHQLDSH